MYPFAERPLLQLRFSNYFTKHSNFFVILGTREIITSGYSEGLTVIRVVFVCRSKLDELKIANKPVKGGSVYGILSRRDRRLTIIGKLLINRIGSEHKLDINKHYTRYSSM